MTEVKAGQSAAGIVIKPRPAKPVTDGRATLFDGLRKLMADCGSNRHDQAETVLTACIGQGINTLPRLRGVMKTLGFNPKHVGILISGGTGTNPALHRWRRDEEGIYSLIAS